MKPVYNKDKNTIKLTLNFNISSLSFSVPVTISVVLSDKLLRTERCSRNWCMLSQATKADSHALTEVTAPLIYASNSCCDIFKDSAVRFSMNDTAQHYKIHKLQFK